MLSKYKLGNVIALCLSAILVFIAVLKINLLPAWLCFVPLFVVLQEDKIQSAKAGIILGITLSLISFFWMIPGAQKFTGSSMLYSIAAFLISSIILIFYWVLLLTFLHGCKGHVIPNRYQVAGINWFGP